MTPIPDEAVQDVAQALMITTEEAYSVVEAIIPHLSAPCAVEVVDRAKRIANIYRNKDDATVIASFHKETARVIDELLSCVVTKQVDVAAVRRQALDEVKSLCAEYGNDSQPDSEYRLACNDLIEAIRALSAEPAQGDHFANVSNMVEALKETRIDLVVLSGNIADAAKSSDKWEGMYDRVRSWIDRIDAALPAAPTTEAGK